MLFRSEANHEWLEADIANAITEIGHGIKVVATDVNDVVQYLGGWKKVSEEIMAIKLAQWALGMVGSFMPLSKLVASILTQVIRINALSVPLAAAGVIANTFMQDQANKADLDKRAADAGFEKHGGSLWNPFDKMTTYVDPKTGEKLDFDEAQFRFKTGDYAPGQRLEHATAPDSHRAGNNSGTPQGNAPTPPLPASQARDNMDVVRATLKGKGWSDAQVAGILTNVSAESRFNPQAVGDGGNAFGLAQWHADRMANGSKFLSDLTGGRQTDFRTATVQQQAEFIDHELRTTEKAAGDRILAATNAKDAAFDASRYYERPAGGDATAGMRASNADDFTPNPAHATAAVPPVAEQGQQSVALKGGADLRVTIAGAPPGSQATASASGNVFQGSPKIAMPMSDQ